MKFAITALLAAAANACDNEWIWEECSWMYYRNQCDDEGWGDGEDGWVYWDDWNLEEFWVTEDEFAAWDWCWNDDDDEDDWDEDWDTCLDDWEWDECYEEWYRFACDDEEWGDGEDGWVHWDDWLWEEYWVTGDDWWAECAW